MEAAAAIKSRIHFLDEVRGFAVCCMVFYHGFFLMGSSFGIAAGEKLFDFFTPAQPIFAGIFILICGISCRLSGNNLKRGVRLLAVAIAISLVTVYVCPNIGINRAQIYFGILHFLSSAILIFAVFSKPLNKIMPQWGILLCTALYVFFSGIGEGVLSFADIISVKLPAALYNYDFLYPLGIHSANFFSADYFPIFPNIFLFLAGSYIGVYASKSRFPVWMNTLRCRFLAFAGRHALIVYIIHQPVIFVIILAAEKIIALF